MSARQRVLLLTRHCPFDTHDGSGSYVGSILDFLAREGLSVHVAWSDVAYFLKGETRQFRRQDLTSAHVQLYARGYSEKRDGVYQRAPKDRDWARAFIGSLLRHRRLRRKLAWNRVPDGDEIRFFDRCLRRVKPDHLIANYAWIAGGIPRLDTSTCSSISVLTHDVWHARRSLGEDLPLDTEHLSADVERQWLSGADNIVSITHDDKRAFERLLPDKTHVYLPKSAPARPPRAPTEPRTVLFVGGRGRSNREGLHWFAFKCWPEVLKLHPDACLTICGGVPVPAGLSNVSAMGWVPDLEQFYRKASVVVVPLQSGSGMKIKLVEAASYSKAIVSTSIGLQGLDFFKPIIPECDRVTEFARAVADRLGSPSLRTAQEHLTFDAVKAHLDEATTFSAFRSLFAPPG